MAQATAIHEEEEEDYDADFALSSDSDLDDDIEDPLSYSSTATLSSETSATDLLSMSGITLVSPPSPSSSVTEHDPDEGDEAFIDALLDALWADLRAKGISELDTTHAPDLHATLVALGLGPYLETLSPAHVATVIELRRETVDWARVAGLSNEIMGETLSVEEVRGEFERGG